MTEGIDPNLYLLIMIPGVGFEIAFFLYLMIKLIKQGFILIKQHLQLKKLSK